MKYLLLLFLLLFSNFVSQSQSILEQNSKKYSIHLGCGIAEYFIISDENKAFTNPIGPSANFYISKDKFIMLVSVQFGNSKVNAQSVSFDTISFGQNSKINFRTNYLGIGYQLISYKNFLIHPYFGVTWSFIKIPESDENIEAWGLCGGISTHLILNPKNREGNYLYFFQNTRFDYNALNKLNEDLSNFAILPEFGICFRFCANTKRKN